MATDVSERRQEEGHTFQWGVQNTRCYSFHLSFEHDPTIFGGSAAVQATPPLIRRRRLCGPRVFLPFVFSQQGR